MWSNTPRLFRGGVFSKIKKEILGARVQEISRIGKNIIFHLSNGRDLWLHLMMTGKVLFFPQVPKEKHVHFWIKFGPENFLALHDIRKFGWIRLIRRSPTSSWKSDFPRLNIGPDALSLSFEKFREMIKKRRGAIKPLFLNQSIISGIGNIYSDEILWHARIHPRREANSLTDSDVSKLYSSVRKVLKLAIKKEGTSSRDYRKPDGSRGGYYEIRRAYQRTGEKCSRDGAIIKRIKVGQRSAHFCPKHQK